MALVGGGVDVSRAYMAKTQLQSACDAGVLAGRRAMSKTGTYGSSEMAKANKMFDFNFEGSVLNVSNLEFSTEDNDDGQVLGTATATLPTLVMSVFSMDTIDLEVECMAELQIGNADVMFVLDVTHSMLCAPEDNRPNCTQYTETDTRSRMYGLREAVKDFHKTVNQAVNDRRTRIRYGFVPYAMTVNVKGLLTSNALSYDDFTDTTDYQSRVPVYRPDWSSPTTNNSTSYSSKPNGSTSQHSTTAYTSQSSCNNARPSPNPTAWVSDGNSSTSENTVINGQGQQVKTIVKTQPQKRTQYICAQSGNRWYINKYDEKRNEITTTTETRNPIQVLDYWHYKKVSYSTSSYKMFQSVPALVGGTTTPSSVSSTWNGCIEERPTVQDDDFDPIPDAAFDLDFDGPIESGTRWRPMWGSVEFTRPAGSTEQAYYLRTDGRFYLNRTGGNSVTPPSAVTAYCPPEMALFRTVELSTDPNEIPGWLTTYLTNLKVAGYTYHDVGMIWGGRLTSPTGLFADNVNLDADKISVSKHIIFMTDGILQPELAQYSTYGLENLDNRIAPKNSSADTVYARHMARFSAVCEAIKGQGTTIWVVAFGTTMTDQLKNCASSGRAYYSNNTEALRNTFKFIAAQVADLRLGA